jgi:GTPase SAR1 family protein
VPIVLLGRDDARVVADAKTAAEVLAALDAAATVSIVLVGCTGVGKSHLLNRLADTDVSEESVIRPTTTSIVTADLTGGTVADTPAWELNMAESGAALTDADIGVLVVTPSRYADAATLSAWKAVVSCPQKLVVLNRQRGTSEERAAVLASVEERFDGEYIVVVEESGDADRLSDEIRMRISDRAVTDARRTIALSTARNAAQHIARAVTASAGDLIRLSNVVESVTRPRIGRRPLAVRESWYGTALEVVDDIGRMLDDLDLEIVNSFGGDLSSRILSRMDLWQRSNVEAALAAWRLDTVARFQAAATIRWRRAATTQMIDDASWMAGVNPSVVVSKRVRRVVGSSLEHMINEAHGELLVIADAAVDSRVSKWRTSIEEAGSFKPGELLAAANALGQQ